MNGWVLYRINERDITDEYYEVNRLIDEGKNHGITINVYSPAQFDLIVTRDDRKSILIDGKPVPLPDFLIPRMGSKTTYFALAIIRHLERLGVHVINSSSSIEAVKDKMYTQQILAESNLPVPKTMLAKYPVDLDLIIDQFKFPVIIKTIYGTQGRGVFLCETADHFQDVMSIINETQSNLNLIIQEYITGSKGRDLRVFVVGGRAIACMERSAQNGGYKANYSQGAQVHNFEMTEEIEWLALESAKILNLDVAGIDLLFDSDHFRICEANSSPGFQGLESCCNVNIADEIFKFIKIRKGSGLKEKSYESLCR